MDLFYEIKWECSEDGTKYSKMVEKEQVFDFFHGLNPELDEVRGRLLWTKPFPSLREAFAKVRREESRRRVMLSASVHSNYEVNTQNFALNTYWMNPTTSKGELQKDR